MLKAINSRMTARWSRAFSLPALIDSFTSKNALFIESRRGYTESKLDFIAIDQKWQQKWASQKLEKAQKKEEGGKKDMYILPMFPYPSGQLHLGHLRVYTIADVISRFRRMKGHNVLHPMGWDAFGLPAENAALERGIDPAVWTKQNIANMKAQLQAMNGDWNWDRELATCNSKFYKHTQQIFLMLHERGLAYQAESLVNYDPVDKTVLANEQVDANGCSWRSGAKVGKKMLKQWFLRISEFQQALLDDLDHLAKDNSWPERVLSMQKNWLGKSEGARIKFPVLSLGKTTYGPVEVFTTRPDTLFGVQYLALASTHPIVNDLAKNDTNLQNFLDEITSLRQDSKAGYLLGSIRGINPLAYEESTPDETKTALPVYVAPYVLGDYGDGAVMGVPGHDTRDHAFWKKNCRGTPVRMVVHPSATESELAINDEPFIHRGVLNSKCGPFSGQASAKAAQNIVHVLNKDAKLAEIAETWRLRDWLVSRQRYWGTPIPIVHCDSCGAVPVPEDQLPVELPAVEGHWLKGKGGNPLEDAHDWVNTECPSCGGKAKRDTDTMDTFVDSSWYFMRFPDCRNESAPFSPNVAEKSLPVDLYIGGVEHAILHLLYARFISKFLSTTLLWPAGAASKTKGEPFKKVITQGMVHGKTYSDPSTGRFLRANEVDLTTPTRPIVIETGESATISFEKMSKSKHNGVDPNTCFSKYGADATRAHILFQAPISEVLEWDEEKISGITRWLKKIHDRVQKLNNPSVEKMTSQMGIHFEKDSEQELWYAVHSTLASVTDSLSLSYNLNTVISDLMSLTNVLLSSKTTKTCNLELQFFAMQYLLQMMAPITPAFAEECWELLHHNHHQTQSQTATSSLPIPKSLFDTAFPEVREMPKRKSQACTVQINGKVKFVIDLPLVPDDVKDKELQEWVNEQVMGSLEGKRRLSMLVEEGRVQKVIVVKRGKTVNYVV